MHAGNKADTMKKIIAIFSITLAIAACGDNNTSTGSGNSQDTAALSTRPDKNSADSSNGAESNTLDPSGGPGGVRSGIGTGDPVISTETKSDTTKN